MNMSTLTPRLSEALDAQFVECIKGNWNTRNTSPDDRQQIKYDIRTLKNLRGGKRNAKLK